MFSGKLAAAALYAFLHFTDPMSFEYSGQTDGAGNAYLIVQANQDLDGLKIQITGDGQTIRKDIGGIEKGGRAKITWKQKSGQAKYQLEARGDNVEAAWSFEIVRAQPSGKISKLVVKSSREDIVKRNQATFQTGFDLVNYEFKVYDSDGDVIVSDTVAEEVPAGGEFTVKWHTDTEVFMIFVRGEDAFGRFTEYKLVPWAVEIPHTEINFDSGKWDIKNQEAPKLDEAVAVAFNELIALDKVNKAVQANLIPKLYIVGYTDTVGSASSNQKLSNSRARQIAEYFRDKGFWAEIYYAGMGERGLRVQTDDNVDEVRNRRALYLIGVQQPNAGGQIPGRWTKLIGARTRPPGFEPPPLPDRWKNYREDRRAKNIGSGGGRSDMSEDLPSSDGGDGSSFSDSSSSDPDMEGLEYDSGGGPPPSGDKPGATSKGCHVGEGPAPLWALGLFVLGAAIRRRR